MEDARAEAAGGPRTLPFHQSLVRPILLWGADRELSLANGVVCLGLLFGIGFSRYTVPLVLVLLSLGHWALVRVARYEPLFRTLYVRHVQLRDVYPAAPTPRARVAVVHPAVPLSE